jgi:CRISPR-associated protein Csm5
MLHELQTWTVQVLTPLHIGDGRVLSANLDFVPSGVKDVQIIDVMDLIEQLEGNTHALNEVGRMAFGLERIIKDYKLKPKGYILSSPGTQPPSEIRSHLKDAHNRVVVPGSSIKGGLRTALLAELYADMRAPQPKINYQAFSKAMAGVAGKDPHHDLLRLLQVSDSPGVDPAHLMLQEVKYLNLMSETEAGWKDMGTKKTMTDFRSAKGVFVEAVKPGTEFAVEMNINRFLQQPLVREHLQLRACSGLASMHGLAEAVNNFSRRFILQEKQFFSHFGAQAAPITQNIERIERLMDHNPASGFCLRIAWGGGWRGMTGNWMDAETLDAVRKTKQLGKIFCPACNHPKPRYIRRLDAYECSSCGRQSPVASLKLFPVFPKTRRLAMSNGAPSEPLGWLALKPCKRQRFFDLALDHFRGDGLEKPSDDPATIPPGGQPLGAAEAMETPCTETALKTEELVWPDATITYARQSGIVTAAREEKKAVTRDKALVPAAFAQKLFNKSKSVQANVVVQVLGNSYTILEIREKSTQAE